MGQCQLRVHRSVWTWAVADLGSEALQSGKNSSTLQRRDDSSEALSCWLSYSSRRSRSAQRT